MIDKKRIEDEAQHFFEWPDPKRRDTVTLTSCVIFAATIAEMVRADERDCRTCAHYAPHHYGEMLHCASPIRCVGASSYKLSGGVQLWEARPIEPAPF